MDHVLTEAARQLLRRAAGPDSDGRVNHVTPESAGWEYVSCAAYRLEAGQAIEAPADDQERLALILEGRARIVAGDHDFGEVGTRSSVFDPAPAGVVLVEPGSAVEVTATSQALVIVASAPGGAVRRTASIPAGDILVEHRGSGRTARRIHHLLPPAAEAGRLIAFEVVTPGGNWSSYPPHKHDTESPPTEARLEELYYYRFAAPQGFAMQRVYTPDRTLDEALVPQDNDMVCVPRGYHPVSAAPGYDCYYLNVMAGPNRAWLFTLDPDHAWAMDWDPGAPATAAKEPSH